MTKALDTALIYRANGMSVIPVRKDTKTPAVTGWKEFAERLPTEAEIRSMFGNRDVNVGIVTGKVSNLVVVDIDDPSKFNDFVRRYPTGRIAKTPKGYHLYYRANDPTLRNSVRSLEDGIDIRAEHGYVVAPPSVSAQGTAYVWAGQQDPSRLPDDLAGRIRTTSQYDLRIASPASINNDRDAAKLYERVQQSGFTAGAHNVEAKDIARYLFRMGKDVNYIVSELARLNSLDPTPLSDHELQATINSGLSYERARLQAKQTEPAQVRKAESSAFDPDDFDVQPYGAVASLYDDMQEAWLIDDWLRESAVMVTAAPPESYKTWLALEAGVNVAFGGQATPFLGAFEGKPDAQPILIVQQEDYMGLLVERLDTIISAKTRNTPYGYLEYTDGDSGERFISYGSATKAPIMLHTRSQLNFEDDNTLEGLDRKIAKYGIRYVMIDPLYMLARADDYFASLARKMSVIKGMRDKYGTTFMFVHHNKKGTRGAKLDKTGDRENMFGSQLLNGAFEGIWLLDQVSPTERTITRRGKVFPGQLDRYLLTFDIKTMKPLERYTRTIGTTDHTWYGVEPGEPIQGLSSIDYVDNRVYNVRTSRIEERAYTVNEQAILDLLEKRGKVTQADAAKSLSVSVPTAAKTLNKLIADHIVEVTPQTADKAQGKEYQLVEQW